MLCFYFLFFMKMLGVAHPCRMPTPTFIIEPEEMLMGKRVLVGDFASLGEAAFILLHLFILFSAGANFTLHLDDSLSYYKHRSVRSSVTRVCESRPIRWDREPILQKQL